MRGLALAFGGLAVALVALGADGPTQTIDVGGLTFDAPTAWKKVQPKSSMRKAQLVVNPAQGDKDPAELVVFVFPEGAGTVEANVQRWQDQFRDAQGKAAKVESKKVKGKNVEVTRVEVSGTYTDPFAGKGAQSDYHLLGAIVEAPQAAYFLKMVGPEKTMAAAESDFDKLIGTLATGER
jgi:hypothetical protein